jgi:hypothetical protein
MSGRNSVESADRKLGTWIRNQLIVVTSHFYSLTGIGNILARHFGAFANLRQPGWEVVKNSHSGAGRMGIIVVVGGAIALLFTLAMFLGSGLMWFSLGTWLTRRCMTL